MTPTRAAVMAALVALFPQGDYFVTVSRRIRLWTDVGAAEKPALFFGEHAEEAVRQSESLPTKITMSVDLFVYTAVDASDPAPSAQIDAALDYIDSKLAPAGRDLNLGRQTLGGLVSHCYVDGKIFKDPGDLDNQGLAVVPVRILIPQGR